MPVSIDESPRKRRPIPEGEEYVELRLSTTEEGPYYVVVEDLSAVGGAYTVSRASIADF